jgi:DNA-binding NarL/FixJ family response regulator
VIKVILLDDEETVRQGLRMTLDLEPDIEVVGEASEESEALHLVKALIPDVVVMDFVRSVSEGMETIRVLNTNQPSTSIIVHSLYPGIRFQSKMRAAGAKAYIEKGAPVEALIAGIRKWAGKA